MDEQTPSSVQLSLVREMTPPLPMRQNEQMSYGETATGEVTRRLEVKTSKMVDKTPYQ